MHHINPETQWRIGIIEDNEDFAENLALLLEKKHGVSISFTSSSIEETVDWYAQELLHCHCVLLDIQLAGMDGVTGIPILQQLCTSGCQIIMLTLQEDRATVQAALAAGASGYLLKTDSILHLCEHVQSSLQSSYPALSRSVFNKLVRLATTAKPQYTPLEKLTEREKDIYSRIVKGYDYKKIAAELGISTATVNFHMQNIFLKLDVHTKAELLSRHLESIQ